MNITIRESSVDKKWRFRFGYMEDWSQPFDSFELAALAASYNGYIWSYYEY